MDFRRYVRQVEGLKRYAAVAEVPVDPYDIPIGLAERLLSYDESITLAAEQQLVYDQAIRLSDEGGPCCCPCWRWFTFRGQAKFLIAERGYDAERIADIWNLEDGCGGASEA